MCGIVGIVSKGDVNQALYDALLVLQHRGQDAAGIMTSEEGHLHLRKSNGLVRDVFHERHMLRLSGGMGIAHTRYPTAGNPHSSESQPFYTNSPYGIGLAHNGNLTNSRALRELLLKEDLRHLNTESDSEVLLNVFAHELQRVGGVEPDERAIFKAVSAVHRRCRGAYAVTVLVAGFGVVGFRDPNGIRPLVFGKRETDNGTEYMLASESVALDVCGFQLVRDVAPGEAVVIDKDGKFYSHQCADKPVFSPCIFEYVYFARPDSTMDDVSVHKARMRMGEKLAEKIQREWPDHDIDVVIPIPDTSRTSALQLANMLGVKYREGFIKNRYIGRTFIMPGQKLRSQSVRQKLNAIDLEFHGKNVLLVDDSIVRGTTSRQIVQMARDVGANKVYFASAAPPVKYPNVYGIDMPSVKELIAHDKTPAEVAEFIGADKLIYQDLNDLIDAVRRGNPRIQRFDTSVFTGEYITGDITPDYLASLEQERSDEAKQKRKQTERAVKIPEGRALTVRDAASPRGLLLDLCRQGIAAVHGRAMVRDWLTARGKPGPFHLISLGKAAAAMAAGALDAGGAELQSGLVVTRYGHMEEPIYGHPRLLCLESGHPFPDAQSLAAGNALLLFMEQAPRDARFLFLISGGTSSLVEVPVAGVAPDELRRLNRWLIGSGLAISDINRVRGAVSRIKGGRLAAELYGRPATQLLISDVPGDVVGDIGSGLLCPSVPRPLPKLPAQFAALPFQTGAVREPANLETFVIASNRHARAAVVEGARAAGHAAQDRGPLPVSDAAACGESIARELISASPGLYVWGGETTVKLPDDPGHGGRNQHLALSAARLLAGRRGICLLAAATDGSDGNDDAGALVDGESLERGRDEGYDADLCLKRAAAGEFLEASGDLLHTGPTGTNVMDLVIGYKS